MYDFTVRLATFASPRLAQRYLLPSLAGRPAETERLLRGFVTDPRAADGLRLAGDPPGPRTMTGDDRGRLPHNA